MNNLIVGIATLAIVVFLVKRGCKPAVSVFILASAAIAIFLFDKLVTVQPFWLISAGLLWLLVALAVLKTARENGRYVIPFLLIALIAIGGVAYAAPKADTANESESQPQIETKLTETGQKSWKYQDVDHSNNRWFTDGIAEIQSANSKEEATAATQVWLEKVKTSPNLLVGAAKFFLKRDVAKESLIDTEGYATDAAIQLVTELSLAIATAQSITPAQAPENGYNSGVENETVVQASEAGISGERKAVQIVLANGETVWVLARCGNPVTTGSPGLPPGKTDNPPAKGGPPPTPPTPDTPITPKDPSQDPAPQGNAPEGEGKNIKPGAGEYIAPEAMPVVPEEPYVAPEPPATPVDVPPIGSEPDPYVPPAPEPEAPTVDDPATGEVPVPGM